MSEDGETGMDTILNSYEPVILSGYMDNWKAREWTYNTFSSILTHEFQVPVFKQSQRGEFPTKTELGFLDFLYDWFQHFNKQTEPKEDIFVGNLELMNIHKDLVLDVFPSPYPLDQMNEKGRLWIGHQGHHSHLHYDAHHGFLCCLKGRKEAWLYHPLQNMIPSLPYSNAASVNPLKIEDQKVFSNVKKFIIEEGQILFIPMYWWHFVICPVASMAVNFWIYPHLPSSKAKFDIFWPITILKFNWLLKDLVEKHKNRPKYYIVQDKFILFIFKELLCGSVGFGEKWTLFQKETLEKIKQEMLSYLCNIN